MPQKGGFGSGVQVRRYAHDWNLVEPSLKWLSAFGLESPGTERDSGAFGGLMAFETSGGFRRIHPSAVIPVVQLKARNGIARAPAERAHGPRKRFSALAHQHTRALVHRAPGGWLNFGSVRF